MWKNINRVVSLVICLQLTWGCNNLPSIYSDSASTKGGTTSIEGTLAIIKSVADFIIPSAAADDSSEDSADGTLSLINATDPNNPITITEQDVTLTLGEKFSFDDVSTASIAGQILQIKFTPDDEDSPLARDFVIIPDDSGKIVDEIEMSVSNSLKAQIQIQKIQELIEEGFTAADLHEEMVNYKETAEEILDSIIVAYGGESGKPIESDLKDLLQTLLTKGDVQEIVNTALSLERDDLTEDERKVILGNIQSMGRDELVKISENGIDTSCIDDKEGDIAIADSVAVAIAAAEAAEEAPEEADLIAGELRDGDVRKDDFAGCQLAYFDKYVRFDNEAEAVLTDVERR